MNPSSAVRVTGAPGLADFNGFLVPGCHEIITVDDRGPLSVVVDCENTPYVVPSSSVEFVK